MELQSYSRPIAVELNFGIPPAFYGAKLGDFPEARKESIMRYLQELQPGLLFLTGPAGTGKTHLAYAIFRNERYNRKSPVFYIVSDLCEKISRSGSFESDDRRFVERIRESKEILILDDLGAERLTDYVFQGLYRILSYREQWALPTVITSNLNLEEIAAKFSDRIASRIASGKAIHFTGRDRRIREKKQQWASKTN
ncbi:MAG: ATP-binding protein [Planctomycetota bacterium]